VSRHLKVPEMKVYFYGVRGRLAKVRCLKLCILIHCGLIYRYELFPLVSNEISDFDLLRALNNGLLPRHYLANNPSKMMSADPFPRQMDNVQVLPWNIFLENLWAGEIIT